MLHPTGSDQSDSNGSFRDVRKEEIKEWNNGQFVDKLTTETRDQGKQGQEKTGSKFQDRFSTTKSETDGRRNKDAKDLVVKLESKSAGPVKLPNKETASFESSASLRRNRREVVGPGEKAGTRRTDTSTVGNTEKKKEVPSSDSGTKYAKHNCSLWLGQQ